MADIQTGYMTPEAKRRLVNRINRATGHLTAIKKMIEDDRCADDVLIQLAAARSAVGQIAAKILEEHLADCMTSCMEGSPEEITQRISKAVATVLRNS
ncbi:MAG: metal-sensitive transcriptional regulator [Planctomycetota bacterium]